MDKETESKIYSMLDRFARAFGWVPTSPMSLEDRKEGKIGLYVMIDARNPKNAQKFLNALTAAGFKFEEVLDNVPEEEREGPLARNIYFEVDSMGPSFDSLLSVLNDPAQREKFMKIMPIQNPITGNWMDQDDAAASIAARIQEKERAIAELKKLARGGDGVPSIERKVQALLKSPRSVE